MDAVEDTRRVLARFRIGRSQFPGGILTPQRVLAVRAAPFKELRDIVKRFDDLEEIAKALGKDDAYVRAYRLVHAMDAAEREGNTCVPLARLVDAEMDAASFEQGFAAARRLRELELHDGHVYKRSTRLNEQTVVSEVRRLTAAGRFAVAQHCAAADDDEQQLTPAQRDAVRMVFSSSVCVLSGYAGTGKTTVIRYIKKVADDVGLTTRMAAPTGAAAKRIREHFPPCHACASGAVGSDAPRRECECACTVHRLLDAVLDKSKRFRFLRGRDNPISAGLVVVDEASMLDLSLTARLLTAVRAGARIAFIGDPCQLPSVMPGRVLHDLLSSSVPHVALTQVMRQAGDSAILAFAHEVRAGRVALAPGDHGDLVWEALDDEGDILQRLRDVVCEWRREGAAFQVLCPMRRPCVHGVSTEAINPMVQKAVNAAGLQRAADQSEGRKRPRIAEGDRVMYTKNSPDIGLLNGDKGWVREARWVAEKDAWELRVAYDGGRCCDHSSSDANLELAWAVTVHKSQGDQYDRVVLVLHRGHGRLLNRELLYTAATRARRHLLLLSDERCVRAAASRTAGDERTTLLARQLLRPPGQLPAR